MFPVSNSLILVLSTVLVAYGLRTAIVYHNRTRRLPPGPRGIPFLGNIFQLTKRPWVQFDAWGKQYGPLIYLKAGSQGILVLNTHQVASDLLDHRGTIYGSRPRLIVASEILRHGLSIPFAQYGDIWRRMRRASHASLTKTRVTEYQQVQSRESVRMVDNLLRDSGSWRREIHRTVASTLILVVYDLPSIDSVDDPLLVEIKTMASQVVRASSPGAHFVEYFPWMLYVPSWMAKWKRDAENAFKAHSKFFSDLFRDVENRINEGDERPSFAGTLIRERERHSLSHEEAAWLAGSIENAGFETTKTTMTWFILAMITYPEKQRKCQEELDAIVGRSRMPTFKDQDHLPYLRATVRELLRWRTVAPLSVPHYTTEDDMYQGYFIPKGTLCFPNAWSMNTSQEIYGSDADDFNPDRFVGADGKLLPALADTKDGHVAFGFGPRICVGRHMANGSLFTLIASILWAMDILPARDEAGERIVPSTMERVSPETQLVIEPMPFDCVITPRFPEVRNIVAATRESL